MMDYDYEPRYGASLASSKSPKQLRGTRTTFQSELDAKMKERRRMGLTADMTTEDESEDDGLGSDDDLLADFNMTSKPRAQQRPGSAKRRGDHMARTTGAEAGGWQPPGMQPRGSPRPERAGKSPRSPPPDLLAEDILRSKPYSKTAPAAKARTKKGHRDEEDRPLTKEEIIFGKKSPKEMDRRSPQLRGNYDEMGKWQPPSFRKTPPADDYGRDYIDSPVSFGRKTPDHLESISESPRPQARRQNKKYDEFDDSSRSHKYLRPPATTPQIAQRPIPQPRSRKVDEEASSMSSRPLPKPRGTMTMKEERGKKEKGKEADLKGRQSPVVGASGKKGSPEKVTTPKPRQKGTPDIFGTSRKTPNYLLDDEDSDDDMKKKRPKTPPRDDARKGPVGRRTPPPGRLTPPGSAGRRTPPGRQLGAGRHTPPPGAAGRKVPPGKSGQDVKGRAPSPKGRDEEATPKKQSVLDFLLDKDKPKEEKEKGKAHRRTESKDSISSELNRQKREASPLKDMLNRATPPLKDRASPDRERRSPYKEGIVPRKERTLLNKDRASPSKEWGSPSRERPLPTKERASPTKEWASSKRRTSPSEEWGYRERASPAKDYGPPSQSKERLSPTKERAFSPDRVDGTEPVPRARGRPMERGKSEERESSLCRDVDRDPEYEANKAKYKEKDLQQKRTTRGPQSTEHQAIDDVIDSVADLNEETSRTMRYIEPADHSGEKKATTPKQKMDPKKVRPQPRYAKPKIDSESPKQRTYDSTDSIRESIFNDWYLQKMDKAKKDLIEKKKKEKEEEQKKNKEKDDKVVESKLAFKAWEENKKDFLVKKSAEKRRKEKEEKKKVEDEIEKKTGAELAYRSWKQNKDAVTKEKTEQEKREERKKEREEARKKHEKIKESKKAQEKWHRKKDVVLTEKEKKEREAKREAKRKEEEEKRKKEEEAMEEYERWIENKERQDRREKTRQHMSTESLSERPAWSPASRTIPFGRA